MDNFEQAKTFFQQGIHDYEEGRFEQARLRFEASLSLVPGRASTLTNLGATRFKLGHLHDAKGILEEALRADPGDPQARSHLTLVLAELGRHSDALALVDESLQGNPKAAPLWILRGTLLRDLGRAQEAVTAFRTALEQGGNAEVIRYFLAALTGDDVPSVAPRGYVQALFDSYAAGFDDHLVAVLRYSAPDVLVGGLQGRRFDRVVDLGCGTGLCGVRLRDRVEHLVGVDLSPNMVRLARDRGVYDEVVQGELVEFLGQATQSADLIVAADVFIYVGELQAVFDAVHHALVPQGVFAFSVELAAEPESIVLRPSLRYAHSRSYVRKLGQHCGFEIVAMEERPIREDQGVPVAGLYVWLRKTEARPLN